LQHKSFIKGFLLYVYIQRMNTNQIWGRRGSDIKIKECPPYHVIGDISLGAGTGQVHSALNMNCYNINDVGLANPGRVTIPLGIGQNKLGNSGFDDGCPANSYFADSTIQHDNVTGNSANVQQIQMRCRNNMDQNVKQFQAGVNDGKNTTYVNCNPGGYFNKVLFTEGGTNLTGIGFDCFDTSEVVHDDGWRRLQCCREKNSASNECGNYFTGVGGACDSWARDFCMSGNNWMMPACVKWAENNSTDMDPFYTSACKSGQLEPVNPITNGNFVTMKFDNGKYLGIQFGTPYLTDIPVQFRIVDTGLRYDFETGSEPIYEFYTVEDLPRYIQIYKHIDTVANRDLSFNKVERTFTNKTVDFEYGNPFQFLIRKVENEDGETRYWIEKFGINITSGGLERYPIYITHVGDEVIGGEMPTFIEIENSDRGHVVCSCINARDDLPEVLVDVAGAQAFCFSNDCISRGGYKTEGQKREPCNQNITICHTQVDIDAWEGGGVDIGKIIINQDCGGGGDGGGDGGVSPPPPFLSDENDDVMKIVVIILVVLLFFILLRK